MRRSTAPAAEDPGPGPAFAAGRRIGVAASGGRDSTALLHATARAARDTGVMVFALHVHHGLQPQADVWWRHVQAQCVRWRQGGLPIRFVATRLAGAPGPGESVEAWARRERYAALASMAHREGVDTVLLAHHRRDQAETVLLQALRGAGPAGLSAMPREIERSGIRWVRPWLDHPREAIEHYLRRYRLRWVDDRSNQDPRYARNRLRLQVWPAFSQAFEHLEVPLCAVARRAQEAQACCDELAAVDAADAVSPDGALQLAPWRALSTARRANLLRRWAQQWSDVGLPESLLQRLMRELPAARNGLRWPAPGGLLCLRQGRLAWCASPGEPVVP
ncbi:MAG: tRNA lysidine(34) synthetase TilS [Rubrivivax sp.]